LAVVFYISGHGFGHASRQVEIINALGDRGVGPVTLRTAVAPDLLSRTLRHPFALEPGACDTGIIQATSLSHDDPATVKAALAFDASYPAHLEAELQRLHAIEPTLIVGDIPPLAFDVAARLGVPSVAIGNFTWDWIYETHQGFLPVGHAALERIRNGYRQATLALALPFATGFEIFDTVEALPLVARRATRSRAETRAHFGLPETGRVLLLSFGGYGLPALDLATVDCRDSWTVVTTDRVSTDQSGAPHVRRIVEQAFLSGDFRYEDLVAAADVVITKPGYGIVSECASTGTAMVYTSRGEFREYDVLVGAMSQIVRAEFISQPDLFAGRWRQALDAVVNRPRPQVTLATNGAEVAAKRIQSML
jgi:UDP:flavonoid glycosyltransferase YjiC (YdhE family)